MPQTTKRVLCVEDNEDIGFILQAVLKQEGFDALITHTVIGALQLVAREEFDLYILDMHYRTGTGPELCRHIRETRPGAKVIFYSGAAFDEDRQAGLAAGARAYVIKPEIDKLLEAVRSVLGTDR